MSGLQSGIVEVKKDGSALFIEGDWEYDPGVPTKDEQTGHNYTSAVYKPSTRYIAGNAKFESLADETEFIATSSATFTLNLANGEIFTCEDAWATRTGASKTESGLVPVKIVARINPNAKKGL